MRPSVSPLCGWMGEGKGIFELLDSIRSLPGTRLKFVGPVERRTVDRLRSLAGDARDRVEIVGPMEPARVYAMMNRSKLVALPSHSEAFPYVLLEALAAKKAVVATDVGAIPDILAVGSPEQCGYCVPTRDACALRGAIDRLLKDNALRLQMGEQGSKRVKRHYVETVVMPRILEHWNMMREHRGPVGAVIVLSDSWKSG